MINKVQYFQQLIIEKRARITWRFIQQYYLDTIDFDVLIFQIRVIKQLKEFFAQV